VSDGNNDDLVSFIVFPGSGSGSASGQSPGLIDGIVNGYISRLSQASNSHALIAFLALGGDLALMKKTLELSDRQSAQFEILKLAFWERRLRW